MTRLALVLFAASLGACSLYDGGDDQPPPMCGFTGEGAPAFESRDPSTGACQFIGGGGGQCTPDCPCPATAEDTGHIAPNWPMCGGPCSGLDEHACLASDSCHAAYTDNAAADQIAQFGGCWDIAPIPVVTGGQCMGLDAWTCAEHSDCASFLEVGGPNPGFSYCGAAPTTTLDPGICDQSGVACNVAPPACPANTVPGVRDNCWSGYCIPTSACPPGPPVACEAITDETTCKQRSADCTAVYEGMNCTCDPSGACTCESETFARCETIGRL